MRRHRPTTGAWVLALLLAVASCSSTTDQRASRRVQSEDGAGATADTADPSLGDGTDASSDGVGAGRAGGSSRRPAGVGGASGGAAGGGGGGGPAPGVDGSRVSQGVTGKEISIGISTASDFSAAASTFGLNEDNDSNADQQKAQAVVDHLNTRGGISGRKIVPVYHDISATGNFDTEAQAACAKWTQDNKVFAALAWLYDRETLVSCLAKANTPLLKSSYQLYDDTFVSSYTGFLYQPDFLFGDHWAVYIDGLVDQGLLRKESRIGLVRLDQPEHERTSEGVLKPALARHGLDLVEEAKITPFNDASEAVGQTNSQIGSAMLRFRNANVDRVIFIDIGNVLAWFFMTQAESQGYRPEYGLNSLNIPTYLRDNVPPEQLTGSLGTGWWPRGDVDTLAGHAGETECVKALESKGLNSDFAGLSYCTRLMFLKAALDGRSNLTPAGLRAAVDGMGSRFSAGTTPTTTYWAGRHDGVGDVRYFRFDPGCTCFAYTGGGMAVR